MSSLPEEWEILLGKNNKVIDLYEIFDISPFEKDITIQEEQINLLELEQTNTDSYAQYCKVVEFGAAILNEPQSRAQYNLHYLKAYSDKVAPEMLDISKFHQEAGSLEKAIEYYQKIISKFKDGELLSQAYYGIGQILEAKGDKQAWNNYKKSLKHNTDNSQAAFKMGLYYQQKQKYTPALKMYHLVLKEKKDSTLKLCATDNIIECLESRINKFNQEIENCNEGIESARKQENFERVKLKEGQTQGHWYSNFFSDIFGVSEKKINPWIKQLPPEIWKICRDIDEAILILDYESVWANIRYLDYVKKEVIQKTDSNEENNKGHKRLIPREKDLIHQQDKIKSSLASYYTALLKFWQDELEEAKESIEDSLISNEHNSQAWILKRMVLENLVKDDTSKKETYQDKRLQIQEKINEESMQKRITKYNSEVLKEISEDENLGLLKILEYNFRLTLRTILCKTEYESRCIQYGALPAELQKEIAQENDDNPKDYTKCSGILEFGLGYMLSLGGFCLHPPISLVLGLPLMIEGLLRYGKSKDETCGTILSPSNWKYWIQKKIQFYKDAWQEKHSKEITDIEKKKNLEQLINDKNDVLMLPED